MKEKGKEEWAEENKEEEKWKKREKGKRRKEKNLKVSSMNKLVETREGSLFLLHSQKGI